jgi:hypothetical protein
VVLSDYYSCVIRTTDFLYPHVAAQPLPIPLLLESSILSELSPQPSPNPTPSSSTRHNRPDHRDSSVQRRGARSSRPGALERGKHTPGYGVSDVAVGDGCNRF